MAARRRKLWAYSAGTRPNVVRVFETAPGSTLQVRRWDATKKRWIKRSLGHRDRRQARAFAIELAAQLAKGENALQSRATLAQVFAAYAAHRTPRKSPKEQVGDARRTELWTRTLGGESDPHRITMHQWETLIDTRLSGAMDARGRSVSPNSRRTIRSRIVERDCRFLSAVFRWASRWRLPNGDYLMRENPVRGFPLPAEKNVRRPVATHDRYEALLAVAKDHTMAVRRGPDRDTERSHLFTLLTLAGETGRRLGAIVALRAEDLHLSEGPHGSIRWPAATDKQGRESTVPVTPRCRAALDEHQRRHPTIGSAPLFPAPGDRRKPMSRHLADKWLRQAEREAGLESQAGSLWHAFRRMWATSRKGLPDADVAAAGGWKNANTLRAVYQQPDEAGVLAVVLNPTQLRDASG